MLPKGERFIVTLLLRSVAYSQSREAFQYLFPVSSGSQVSSVKDILDDSCTIPSDSPSCVIKM